MGVRFGYGAQEQCGLGRPTAKERTGANKRRGGRIAQLRRTIGGRVARLVTTGVLPAMMYGASVVGVSDCNLDYMKRVAAMGVGPVVNGRSLDMAL